MTLKQRFARYRYIRSQQEGTVKPTAEEDRWWSGVSGPVIGHAFRQALGFTGVGISIAVAITMAGQFAAGRPFSIAHFMVLAPLGVVLLISGWSFLTRTRKDQMIRSKRLRDAMAEDDAADDGNE